MDSAVGLPSSPRPSNTPTSTYSTPSTCPPPLPPRSSTATHQHLALPSPTTTASTDSTPTLANFSSTNSATATAPPPLPPRLSLTTTFVQPLPAPPLTPSASTDALAPPSDALQDPELPTYAHLQSQGLGNPRFGRWKGWIEKRARERKDERDAMREAGVPSSSGWDLPDVEGGDEARRRSDELSFKDSEDRARDARAEQRLSRQSNQRAGGLVGVTVTNPDPPSSNPSFAAATSAERELKSPAMSPSSSLLGQGRVQELTKSMGIHPLGGRFAKGVEGRVRTGCLLPSGVLSGGGAGGSVGSDRFMLIGTDEGLTLLDLNPLLSSTAPLRTSAQPSLSDASIHPLWTGLGVLQLEVILERSTLSISAAGGAPVGLVIGLVKPEGGGEVELRMWSLAALSNLARWKVFNESSPPLDLSSPSSASNASPTTSIEGKRSSRSYIKSLFSSSPTSPVDTKGKGKARAFPSASAAIPTPLRETTDEEEGFVVLGDSAQDSRGHSRIRSSISDTSTTAAAPTTADSETRFFVPPSSHPVARLSSESLRPSSISSSLGRTTPTPISPSNTNANLSLPLSWANSSIRFPLPKNATPILFFTLCRTPPPSPPSTPAHPRREAGIRERRSRAEKERQEEERREAGRVWLLVATSRTVYVYESGEGGQRRWRLRREFYAPATPKLLTLIRALPPHGPNSPPPLGLTRRDSARKSKRSTSPPPSSSTTSSSTDLPPDLTLYLTMRSKSVLINLVDSSVREVSLPPSSAPGHGRSGSTLQAASSLTARAVEVGKRKVEKMVEGRQGVPVGMRGEGGMGLVKGRKVGDGAGAGAVVGGGEEGGGGDWVGCQRLSMLLPGGGGGGRKEAEGERSRRRTDLLLLTKGSTTSIYPSPLPSFTPSLSATSSSSSTPLLPPSTLPTPLASFSFPLTSSSPLLGLTPLVRRDLKPSYAERGMQHLVLTAWTRSGVHVKEGVVDPFALGAGGGGRWFTPLDEFEKKVGESVLLSPSPSQPTTTTTERDGAPNDDDDDEELEGQASLDFGREILQLGVGGSVLHLPPPSSSRPALGDSEDSDDDEESEFGDGAARRAREEEEEEEVRRETEGGVFFCVRGVEDWGLKWVG